MTPMAQWREMPHVAVLSSSNDDLIAVVAFASSLRRMGINTASTISHRKLQKQIKWARDMGANDSVIVSGNQATIICNRYGSRFEASITDAVAALVEMWSDNYTPPTVLCQLMNDTYMLEYLE